MTNNVLRISTNDYLPVLTRLHQEWRRITIRSSELREVRQWGLPGGPVGSLDDILDRCGYLPDGSTRAAGGDTAGTAADDYLLRIVELASTNGLAARIVLQRILPPLSAVARRHSTNHPNRQSRQELMDELVANAWLIIRKYPTSRRGARVASNLVHDITFETLVRPTRRRSFQEVPTEYDMLGDPAEQLATEPLHELVGLLRDAQAIPGISGGDIAFICQLINHGKPERLAAALDVTPRTVRNHRDAVVHRLRAMVSQAA